MSDIKVTTSVDIGGSVSLTTNLDQRRTGVQHTIREQIDTQSLGDRVVSRNIITYTRSRDVEFTATRMKPYTQVYAFFDGIDVTQYCVPKLIEIEMISGVFTAGEEVRGEIPNEQITLDTNLEALPFIRFRLANIDHKYGPYNSPTTVFTKVPYNRDLQYPTSYNQTSNILNVDTFSLANEDQGDFVGFIRTGMILNGTSSGATARISNVRLITDNVGTLIGSFFIPNGNIRGNPRFETGRNSFRLTSSPTNTSIQGLVTTTAEEIFYSQGDIDNTQEVTLSLRNARVTQQDFNQTRTLTSSVTARANASSTSTGTASVPVGTTTPTPTDPGPVLPPPTVNDPCPDAPIWNTVTRAQWTQITNAFQDPTTGTPQFTRVKFQISGLRRGLGGSASAEAFINSFITPLLRGFVTEARTPEANVARRFVRNESEIGNILTPRGVFNFVSGTLNGQPYPISAQAASRAAAGRITRAIVFAEFLYDLPDQSIICVDIRDLTRTIVDTGGGTPLRHDPLAQSFFVDEPTGIFITKVGIFFASKETGDLPVICQIREMKLGIPSETILAYSEVELTPDQVNISDDASAETIFTFESPVYLSGNKEYAIVLLSPSSEYNVWISRFGEFDVSTGGADALESNRILVSSQPLLGTLFKSQNAATWTPSQYEDLKFNIYRASFVDQGSVQFFNPPELPRDVLKLTKDPFDVDSRKVRIGIGTTIQDASLTNGNTILQLPSNANGNLVGTAGSISTLSINNSGIGYTPSIGSFTFNNVLLKNVISTGKNASADITISNGVAVAATVRSGGYGYSVGDVLSTEPIGISSLGRNIRFNVSQLSGYNELIIDDVQGEFVVGAAQTIYYINNSGITTALNSTVGAAVTVISAAEEISDGLHFKVFHRNHGMLSDANRVTISKAQTDIEPSKLTAEYLSTSSDSISIESVSNFTTFEGVGIATTNPGYIIIKDEIIKYTGVTTSNNQLTGITRQIRSTNAETYSVNSLVYKYELNGVSLLRINKTHILSDSNVDEPIGLDYYHIKIDPTDTDTETTDRSGSGGFGKLYFRNNKECGGRSVEATYNIPFEAIEPYFGIITPQNTSITSLVRTVSGKSVDGTETPFVDRGFQPVTLNTINYFDSPRIVASKINEDNALQALPGRKSFTMNINMLSEDNRLSPAIDLQKTSIRLISNRINSPVTDYVNDGRVNTIGDDPNNCFYVSKPITLQNPATSLRVILSAAVNQYNDLRAFYSIQKTLEETPIFVPFPGYSNLRPDGFIIDPSQNNGESDKQVVKNSTYEFVPSPRSFKEYEFNIDNLTSFNIFRIKLIMTSTNQAYVPIVQDLRVIALA